MVQEEKHEENREVLGAAGVGEFTSGKDVRVIENEAELRRFMSHIDPSQMETVLRCAGKKGRICQGLNHMKLVGALIQLKEGEGQVSIFWSPQALRLILSQ